MALNKVTKGSNMYQGWITHTWNTVKGKCPHDTEHGYCYMKKWGEQPELHFDEKELKTNLGTGNFVFTSSSCDLFADKIPDKWIVDTLDHCNKFDNRYLFQSKNPERFWGLRHNLPENSVVGTTIESNRIFKEMCNAPNVTDRAYSIKRLSTWHRTFITLEPIMDFDIEVLVELISGAFPVWVNIGANTNSKVKLTEPSPEKVTALIDRLSAFTKVKIKSNLKRLMRKEE